MNETKLMPNLGEKGVQAESRLRDGHFVMSGHHCHTCCELFYVETGSCRFLVDQNMYDLHAGDFILIPPMTLHYTRYPFGACRRTVILFSHQDLSGTVLRYLPRSKAFLNEVTIFQVPQAHREQVGRGLEQLIAEERINDERSPEMRRMLLQGLLLLCSRICTFLLEPPTDIHTTDPHIIRAARYINANYMQPITTADVAAEVGFSPNYLSRKFRQEAGIGLHEYIIFIRLHHAALELVSTDDSITTIAFRCGFSDSNYFKDVFKKKYGITPRNYRKLS